MTIEILTSDWGGQDKRVSVLTDSAKLSGLMINSSSSVSAPWINLAPIDHELAIVG